MFDGIDNAYPLTPLQEGILYEVLNAPAADIYVAYVLIEIHGKLNESAFKSAWHRTIEQYDVLRTRFVWEGLDEPLQLVDSAVSLQWNTVQLERLEQKASRADDGEIADYNSHDTVRETAHETARQDVLVEQWLTHERRTPLSLHEYAPQRFRLVQLKSDRSVLIWTVHHLLADDWSTPVVLKTVLDHYSTICELSSVGELYELTALPYASYVDWVRSSDRTASEDWWKQTLAQAEPTPVPVWSSATLDVKDGVVDGLFDGMGSRVESGTGEGEGAGDGIGTRVSNGANTGVDTISSQFHPRLKFKLGAAASQGISAFCLHTGVTQSSLYHAAWALTLAQYAGTRHPMFGTSVSGRTCPLPDIEHAVGLFLNTLPTRVHIDPEQSVVAYAHAVQALLFEQLSHEHVPLSVMRGMSSTGERQALFESVLVVESHGTELNLVSSNAETIRFGDIRYETDSNYPLTVLIFPGAEPEVHLLAKASFIDSGYLSILGDEFLAILMDLISAVDTNVAAVIAKQQARLVSQTPAGIPLARPPFYTMDKWLVHTALERASAIALVHDQQHITYGALLHRALSVASDIEQLASTAECIGVYIGRSVDQIVGVLGVILSGKGYLALDIEWPVDRISSMVSAAQVTHVLSRSEDLHGLNSLPITVVSVNAQTNEDADLAATVQSINKTLARLGKGTTSMHGDSCLAYMMFTSGSTGKPKAVPISHRNLVYSTAARMANYPDVPSAFLLLSSLAFDSSVAGLFWTLCGGGTLILQNDTQSNDVHELARLIEANKVSHTLCLPSIYALLLQYSAPEKLQSLNTIIVAGEACPDNLPECHRQLLPEAGLYNEYGPTEATVWSSVACLHPHSRLQAQTPATLPEKVTIGYPIPGCRLYLQDSLGQLCPPGVIGEIVISSPGVVTGYPDDPVATEQSFQASTLDDEQWGECRLYRSGDQGFIGSEGSLHFRGRVDDQVKIRGYRVEPGEITWRVERQNAVLEACCIAVSNNIHSDNRDTGLAEPLSYGSPQLVCYVVPADAHEAGPCRVLDGDDVLQAMQGIVSLATKSVSEELPSYFAVSRFVALNCLPRLPNGKIDRRGFPALTHLQEAQLPNATVTDTAIALSNTAAQLCQLLMEQFGLAGVKASDNFFSLGGDSLSAIRFVARCRERGMALTIPMVSRHSTIAALGLAVDASSSTDDSGSKTGSIIDAFGETALTPIQRWFFAQHLPAPEHWNMGFLINLGHAVDVDVITRAICQVVCSLPVLGTCFLEQQGGWAAHIPEHVECNGLVRRVAKPESEQDWVVELVNAQQSFDLSAGRLVAFVLGEERADGNCRTIGVVIHHLVTDALSNQFLADRIARAIAHDASAANETGGAEVLVGDTSYRTWATHIDRTISPQRRASEPAVTSTPWKESGVLVRHSIVNAHLLTTLKATCQALNVELHEALLFALLRSVSTEDIMQVDLEIHGRDLLADEIDVSTSIGWFTSFLRGHPALASSTSLNLFSQNFRQSSVDGRLKFMQEPEGYLTSVAYNNIEADRGATLPLMYNYLAGSNDRLSAESTGSEQFSALLDARLRHSASPRSHPIECIVVDGQTGELELLWRIDSVVAQDMNIDAWQADFLIGLEALCTDKTAFDSSNEDDFAGSGLDADELSKLLDSLG